MIVSDTCGLYYKNITIVNDTSRVVRMTPQLGASLMIVILTIMLLQLSIMLLENIYSTGVTHDNRHMMIKIFFIVQAIVMLIL